MVERPYRLKAQGHKAMVLLPWLIVLAALAARLIPTPRTIDDAYITFRYARNLLAGEGFVFNPGERVLGTTTPLYTLLMAGLGLVSGGPDAPFPSLALGLNALAGALTCWLLARLGKRLGSRPAGLAAAALWAVAPFSVTFAIGGMETSIFVLLLVSLAVAYLENRHALAAALASLALLTRPDALILVGPVAADFGLRWVRLKLAGRRMQDAGFKSPPISRPQLPITNLQSPTPNYQLPITNIQYPISNIQYPVSLFLLPLVVWTLFATAYFGSPIPHSVAAKAAAYRLPPEAALVRLMQHYATPFLEHRTFGTRWIAAGLILYPTLSGLGALSILRSKPRAWPLLAYPWLYFATFALANPLIFRWYLTPPLPFLFLSIFLGLAKITSDIARSARRQLPVTTDQLPVTNLQSPIPSPQSPIPILLFLLPTTFFLLLSLHGWTLHPDHGPDRPAPAMAWHKLELLYEGVGRDLAPEVTPETVLAAGDVGALGYYSGARILDTVGLNSPQAAAYYPLDPALYVINYAIPPDLILDQSPTWVVILEVYGREGLLKDARFLERYRLREKIPTDIYGSDGLLVFEQVGE